MPFIKQELREKVLAADWDDPILYEEPGNLCFKYYHQMVTEWKKEPRWRTAHNIFKELVRRREHPQSVNFEDLDHLTAKELAWQIFLKAYIIPYEMDKELENGTI